MSGKKKHILVISQYFYPEQFRINDICADWVKRGYEITVITGIPNYPQGQYYKGYGLRSRRIEEWNGIKIIRIPLIPRGQSSIGMVLNYLSFVLSGFVWKSITKIKADFVFIFGVSPMTQSLIGVWYAKKRKIPCYLYVQDLWPENVECVAGIHSPFIIRPIERMVSYIYQHCAHIFATSPSFVEEIRKHCTDGEKVSYWPQYAEKFYRPLEKEWAISRVKEIRDDDTFKVVFTGNIGRAQGIEILPLAAKKLKKEHCFSDKQVSFIVVGDGRNLKNFELQIKEAGVGEMFLLVSRQPAKRIPEILGCCDAAFLSFMDNELFAKTIPAKLQSYMACGMPIAASASGETKRVIEEADCGVCVPTGDVDALAEKIKWLAEQKKEVLSAMGKNAREYCQIYFDKKQLMDELEEYFL